MSEALFLRQVIFNTLSSLLGTYTFANGVTTPALAVISGNGEIYPPDGTKVEGLEVVIFTPTYTPAPLFKGHKVRQEWVIHVKQWQVGTGVQIALEGLLSSEIEGFVITQINQIPADYRMGIPAGAQVKLSSFVFT